MKSFVIAAICIFLFALIVPMGLAAEGDAKAGEKLFKDAGFAGGKKSCNDCHPNGRGLEKSGAKKSFAIMGKTQNSLEDAVNFCIINANKGRAIPANSKEMTDMVAYIKSLGKDK